MLTYPACLELIFVRAAHNLSRIIGCLNEIEQIHSLVMNATVMASSENIGLNDELNIYLSSLYCIYDAQCFRLA